MAAPTNLIIYRLISLSFLMGVIGVNIYAGSFLWLILFGCLVLVTPSYLTILSKKYFIVIIVGLSIGCSFTLYHHTQHASQASWLEQQSGYGQKEVLIETSVIRMTRVNDQYRTYKTRLIRIGGQSTPSSIFILISIPKNLHLEIGQDLTTYAKLSFPKNTQDVFQYKTWLHMQKIYATIRLRTLPEKEDAPESGLFATIRNWGEHHIRELYPEKHAKFLSGILLGERRELSKETKDAFMQSGLMHIIAVSGFNITILILFCQYVFRHFSTKIRIPIVLLMIAFFVGLVGYQVPVVRAALIGSINYLALCYGARVRIFHLLIASLLFFCLLNPLSIVYDLSLILSYLSVLGIIIFQKCFSELFSRIPNILELRSALVMTMSSMAFTLPISIVYFERFSIISPLANILAGAAIPPAMLFGFLSVIAHSISTTVGVGLGWVGWLFLNYILQVVSWSGTRSWSSIETMLGDVRWHFFWIYIIAIAYVGFKIFRQK